MPITESAPGVALSGEFDRTAPDVKDDLARFEARLSVVQRQLGFAAFVPVIREQGDHVTIMIIPCALGAPGSVADATSLGLSGDVFKGSGRLPAAPSGPDPYAEATPQDAGDMAAGWFTEAE